MIPRPAPPPATAGLGGDAAPAANGGPQPKVSVRHEAASPPRLTLTDVQKNEPGFVVLQVKNDPIVPEMATAARLLDTTGFYPARDGAHPEKYEGDTIPKWTPKYVNHALVTSLVDVLFARAGLSSEVELKKAVRDRLNGGLRAVSCCMQYVSAPFPLIRWPWQDSTPNTTLACIAGEETQEHGRRRRRQEEGRQAQRRRQEGQEETPEGTVYSTRFRQVGKCCLACATAERARSVDADFLAG